MHNPLIPGVTWLPNFFSISPRIVSRITYLRTRFNRYGKGKKATAS